MNTYKVFIRGTKDENGNYIGGECVGTFQSERKAWEVEREYFSKPLSETGYVYKLREGDEVFTIVHTDEWYMITDKSQKSCYGMCRTLEEATREKAWCEKFHTLGWYYE